MNSHSCSLNDLYEKVHPTDFLIRKRYQQWKGIKQKCVQWWQWMTPASAIESSLAVIRLLDSNICKFCESKGLNPHSKRIFRVLMSVATEDKVFAVICFDRAARVLFGCSADEFYNSVKLHPLAVATASKILEGEMLQMTLSKPNSRNGAVAIIPFQV